MHCRHAVTTFAALLATLWPAACFDDSPEGQKARKESSEAVDALGEYAGKKKDEVVAELRRRLEGYDEEIERLKQEAAAKGSELQEDAKKAIEALEGQAAEARDAMNRLIENREEVWSSLRDGAARSFDELKRAVEDAREKIK